MTIRDELASRLEDILAQPTPIPVIVTTFAVPFVIAYLVQLPNTRVLRIGLWPVGLICWVWLALTVRLGPIWSLRFALTSLVWNVGAGTRWAFSKTPPQFHPLPRQPFFPQLRNSRLFKSWELVYTEHRHIGLVGYGLPLKPSTQSYPYLRGVAHQLFNFIYSTFLADLSSLPIAILAPTTIGNVNQTGGDYTAFCQGVAKDWGVSVFWAKLFFALCYGTAVHFGMTCAYHLLALLGVASGVYLPEEWPAISHQPPYATSLNELWSVRWHQMMRDFFTFLARPFRFLPKPLYLITIFLFSAILHIGIYYPRKRQLIILPYLAFFTLNGVGIALERTYRKITGRRVGGIAGWIWTWTFLFATAWPMVEAEYGSGWVGAMRSVFSTSPEQSMVIQLMYWTGMGKEPDAYRQVLVDQGFQYQ